MRRLITGRRLKELKVPVKWSFESRCPAKWIHVDCECGHVYAVKSHPSASWKEPSLPMIDAAIECLKLARRNLTGRK